MERSRKHKELAALLLLTRIRGAWRARVNSFLQFVARESLDLHSAVLDDKLVIQKLKISIAQYQESLNHYRQYLNLSETIGRLDIQYTYYGSSDYPKRLYSVLNLDSPSVIYYKGNYKLLSKVGIGFCGSRKSSSESINLVAQCAEKLALKGINVISGNAIGVDDTAHNYSIQYGGTTTYVLPEGILNYKPRRTYKDYLTEDNHIILSEFYPTNKWSVRNAMRRNATIFGFSQGMVVVESRDYGGTFDAGNQAIKYGLPIFIIDGKYPVNQSLGTDYFVSKGGRVIGSVNGIDIDTLLEFMRDNLQNYPLFGE